MLGRRRQAGAIVAQVVEVGPAANDGVAQLGQQRLDSGVQFALAEIAAGAVVADVIRIGEFARADDDVPDADLRGETAGVGEFRRATLGLSAVTATAWSPSASRAALATTVLSTPPLNATATRAIWHRLARSRSFLASSSGVNSATDAMVMKGFRAGCPHSKAGPLGCSSTGQRVLDQSLASG